METVTLKQMRASEVHRIVAAVLEVMEKAQFEPKVDVELQETDKPENWKMVFQKKCSNLNELNNIKNELGKNFNVCLEPKDKTSLTIIVEAPSEDFISLLKKKPVTPARTIFGNNEQKGSNGHPDS